MEGFGVWKYALVAGVAILVIAIALAIARRLRARRLSPPVQRSQPSPSHARESDDELLDSSHIGFAPLIDPVTLPPRLPSNATPGRKA
jgi:hypothetical protein